MDNCVRKHKKQKMHHLNGQCKSRVQQCY